MKTAQHRVVFVTAPDVATARRLATLALEARLVACANLISGVESHYWWKKKVEYSKEILVIFKTIHRKLGDLEKLILKNHPYDTPEFVVLPITDGSARYLTWISESCPLK